MSVSLLRLSGGLALLCLGAGYAGEGLGQEEGVSSRVLLKSSRAWDGSPYRAYPTTIPELSIVKIALAPHTVLAWHKHPVPNAAYIVSGEIVVEKMSNGETRTLRAGDVLAETMNVWHRGYTRGKGVELIAFYAGTPGTPMTVPYSAKEE